MSGETIRYVWGENYAALDDIQRAVNNTRELADEVHNVFEALAGVFEGDAATALQTRRIQLEQGLENLLAEIEQTRQGANQQQDDAQALDGRLAGLF